MKHLICSVFILTFFCGLSQEKPLTATESQQFKQKIQKGTKNIQTIKTDFTQEKHLSFLSHDIASSGKMYLKSNGTLKWAYLKPNKYSIIFEENAIYINDNGDKKTVQGNQKLFDKLSHLIAGSISGKLFNAEEFQIAYFKTPQFYIVKLKPFDETLKKYIKAVHLFFPKKGATVSQVKLIEPSGDYTFIHFINKQINVPINPDVFQH